MIVVSGTIDLDPANADAAVTAFTTVAEATLAEEGCSTYGFWADPAQPGRYRVFEEWADQAALDAHFATPHLAAFLGGIGTLGVTGTDISKYQVGDKSKLM